MSRLWTTLNRNVSSIVFTVVALALALAGLAIAKEYWGWLRTGGATAASNGETLRNVGILIGLLVAFVFGLWRAWLQGLQANAGQVQAEASRAQVEATQLQVEAVQRQVEISQQGILNERYQRGAEMMSSGVLTARLGGIYALQQLVEEHTEQYQVPILRLFCAFVRDPDGDWDTRRQRKVVAGEILPHSLRQDLQAAAEGISGILTACFSGDTENSVYVDLRGAPLSGIHLEGGNFSGVDLSFAELVRADFEGTELCRAQLRVVQLRNSNLRRTNLSGATISSADLADADFSNATLNRAFVFNSDLSGATFHRVALSGTVFSGTRVTQTQLDQAVADLGNPPKFLDESVDHTTGQPLHWHGEPLN